MNLFEVILNAFGVPELRRRVLFTLGTLAIYRLGSQILLPGLNISHWAEFAHRNQDSFLGMANLFSGGNISRMTVFALGITPYITASIFLQLMAVVVPSLARLWKEGEMGRKKITQWTRYLTAILAVAESAAVAGFVQSQPGDLAVFHGPAFLPLTMISLSAGTMFLMWLGEQITERGLGNGISLIIFAGIVTGLPQAAERLHTKAFVTHEWSMLQLAAILIVMILVIAFVVLVESGERRIPVQYAKRMVGGRIAGGQSTYIPMKVNAAGVVPVIFASAILTIPQMVATLPFFQNMPILGKALQQLHRGEPLYYLVFSITVMFFCFFYVSIIFNPVEAADNLRKYGGFVAGKRPGRETTRHFDKMLTRLTAIGGVYLVALCLIPDLLLSGIKLQHLPFVGNWVDASLPRFVLDGLNVNFSFGGTSLLIVVGVAMDLVSQVESQLIMRHYETYTRGSRRRKGVAARWRVIDAL